MLIELTQAQVVRVGPEAANCSAAAREPLQLVIFMVKKPRMLLVNLIPHLFVAQRSIGLVSEVLENWVVIRIVIEFVLFMEPITHKFLHNLLTS